MYLQCMPRVRRSPTFEPTRVDYLVDVSCAFETVGHACATKCEKCEEGKACKAYVLR